MLLKRESEVDSRHLFSEGLYFQYFGISRYANLLSHFSRLAIYWGEYCIATDTIAAKPCIENDTNLAGFYAPNPTLLGQRESLLFAMANAKRVGF